MNMTDLKADGAIRAMITKVRYGNAREGDGGEIAAECCVVAYGPTRGRDDYYVIVQVDMPKANLACRTQTLMCSTEQECIETWREEYDRYRDWPHGRLEVMQWQI